ncbi:MAG: DMT family transporter [Flavobacteriales bacterium]|nr:DMT family transporter [Flavobacteriales bacterium]
MSKGIKSILIATLFFAAMNVFVKLLPGIPALEIVLFRSLFTLIASYIILKKAGLAVLGSGKPVLFLRGIFGTFSLIFFFKSLQILPLATATLVHYITPFFTTFFGFVFLKEKFYRIQWLFLVICFTGIVITQSENDLSELNPQNLGILYGLAATVMAAGAYNCIRKIGASENANVILFYFPLVSLPVAITGLYFQQNFVMPVGIEWLYLLLMGALTQGAQYFLTRAYQNEKVANLAIFTNIGIVYAIINGIIFFGEIPSRVAWIGIFIVLSGLVLNLFAKKILGLFRSSSTKIG